MHLFCIKFYKNKHRSYFKAELYQIIRLKIKTQQNLNFRGITLELIHFF